MAAVFPEVEDAGATPGNDRNVVWPVEDRRKRIAISFEAGVAEAR